MMSPERRAKLEAAGFTIGDAADFLMMNETERRELDERCEARRPAREAARAFEVEDRIGEVRVRLGREVRRRRDELGLSQAQLADRIGSTASRISKVEVAAIGVGLDLMLRALFAAGGRLCDLGEADAPGLGVRWLAGPYMQRGDALEVRQGPAVYHAVIPLNGPIEPAWEDFQARVHDPRTMASAYVGTILRGGEQVWEEELLIGHAIEVH